jgi:epoxyqueuosine reductase QueG
MEDWTRELKVAAKRAGADLVGAAGLEPFRAEGTNLPPQTFDQFTSAVSVAVRLDSAIIDDIQSEPTPEYAQHYRAVNAQLDGITSALVTWITSCGFSAASIPSSRIVDETHLLGGISHKAVARMAGIGWQGKSLLIVSPAYGPRIRLATLLTDMPLIPNQPLKNRCGTCEACTRACPASAIKNVRTRDRYNSREEALHFSRCVEHTRRFKSDPAIGAQVCGVCVKVCPFGSRPDRRLV